MRRLRIIIGRAPRVVPAIAAVSLRATLAMLCLALFLPVAAAGCGGPTYVVQQYDGPVRSPESIAIIRINGKEPLGLDSLDGESVGVRASEDSRIHVEVLPGKHRLRVRDLSNSETLPGFVAFMAKPGKVYRPLFSRSTARIFEVDRDSDALLTDATLSEP